MKITPTTADAFKLFMEGAKALAQIEANGIAIDVEKLDRSIQEAEDKVNSLKKDLEKDEVFTIWKKEYGGEANLGSNTQLAHVLYNKLGIECKQFTSGGKSKVKKPSVSESALQDVSHPFVKKLFSCRHLEKTVGTFLKGIRKETVKALLHPDFNLNTVVSFRSSSSSPNFQNQPRRDSFLSKLVRSCIIARKGRHFWELDFKGSEVCCNAVINQDPVLLEYVRTDPGRMHKDAAAELFMLNVDQVIKRVRDRAKNQFVFASFYGSYHSKTSRSLWEDICRDKELLTEEGGIWLKEHLANKGIKELGDCNPGTYPRPNTFEAHVKKVEDAMWKKFHVYYEWREKQWENYQRKGYFDLPTGFRIQWGVSGPLSKNDSICYPAQGVSFHCLLYTLIRLQKWLVRNKMKTCLVGQIHDSIEGDSPPEELDEVLNEAKRIVAEDLPRHWPWLIVPMQVEVEVADIGGSWWSKKEWICNNGHWTPKELVA